MRPPRVALGLILAATLAHVIGHAQAPAAGPTFDVVSVKPSPPQTRPVSCAKSSLSSNDMLSGLRVLIASRAFQNASFS